MLIYLTVGDKLQYYAKISSLMERKGLQKGKRPAMEDEV